MCPSRRLVNCVADSQQKGKNAVSVAMLAASAGLPRTLVDIRHEATHHELPSLPLLRLGVQQALGWLKDTYWWVLGCGGKGGRGRGKVEGKGHM